MIPIVSLFSIQPPQGANPAVVPTPQLQKDPLIEKSLLNLFDKDAIKDFGVSDGALMNICLGSSSVEIRGGGWHERNAYPYFFKLFQFYAKNEGLFTRNCFPEKILPCLEQLVSFWDRFKQGNLEKFADDIAESINNLTPDNSYLMGSGWSGYPSGHSMIIRFEKNEVDEYDIYVYGASGSWGKKKIGGRYQKGFHSEYDHPYIKFEHVKLEELFFTSDNCKGDSIIIFNLLKLLETSYRGDLNINSVMSLLTPIRHRFVPGKELSSKFITRQRGPNCIAKTFNCLLLDLIDDRKIFKRIALDNRLFTQIFYFVIFRDHFINNQMMAFRFKQAAMSLLRSLRSNISRWVLENNEYSIAVATLSEMLDELSKPVSIQSSRNASPPIANETELNNLVEENRTKRKEGAFKPITANATKAVNPGVKCDVQPALGKDITWHGLLPLLKDLVLKKGNSQHVAFQIEMVMENISHLKQMSPRIERELALEALTQCKNLVILYVGCIHETKSYQSCATQNAIMEMLAISYLLAVRSDEEKRRLKDFGIYFDYFKRQDSLFLFGVHDPGQLKHRNELIQFFSKLPSTWKLFQFEKESFHYREFYECRHPETQLFLNYIPGITPDKKMLYYQNMEEFPEQFKHLKLLNYVAGLALSLFKFDSQAQYFCFSPRRTLLSNDWIDYQCGYFRWKNYRLEEEAKEDYAKQYFNFQPSESNERKLPPRLQALLNSQLWGHDVSKLSSENQWQSQSATESFKDYRKAFSALCVPKVEISVLFRVWTELTEELANPEWRALFENMFYKTTTEYELTQSPLFQSLKLDPYILQRIEHLTKDCFLLVRNLPFTQDHVQKLLGFLSVLRLRSNLLYLKRVMTNNEPLSKEIYAQREMLLIWVEQFLSSPVCVGGLKKELLLCKTILLMEKKLTQLEMKERVQLALTYCILQPNLGSRQKAESPVLQLEIQRRWLKMIPEWTEFFQKGKNIDAFFSMLITQINGSTLEGDFNLNGNRAEFGQWWYDFAEAEIGNSSGRWNQNQIELPSNRNIKRLFSDRKNHLSAFGQIVSFTDSVWGEIEIDLSTDMIARKYHGKNYQYIEYAPITLQINCAIEQHAMWKSLDATQHFIFCDLKTGETRYEITNDGKLCSVNGSKEYVDSCLDQFNIAKFVRKFEDQDQICCFMNRNNEWSIEFPRFKTSLGGVLRFIFDKVKGSWFYSDNPDYMIDLDPFEGWGFNCCLNLISKDGAKRLVLVPKGEIFSNEYDPNAKIVLPSIYEERHKGTLSFFEFEVLGDCLTSRSLNGKLYLGSLALASKEYQTALGIFQEISMSHTPDDETWRLFEKVMIASKAFSDFSPNAIAVRLDLLHIFIRLNPFASLYQKKEFVEALHKLYKIYLRSLANVESPLFLESEDEIEIIQKLQIPDCEDRVRYLQGIEYHELEYVAESIQGDSPGPLRMCNGYFPLCITHILSEEENKKYFLDLVSDGEFEKRYKELYEYKHTDPKWRRMIYRLATQPNYTHVDKFILFFAHVYERKGIKINVTDRHAKDDIIRDWHRLLNSYFHSCRKTDECFKPCNRVALEFAPPRLELYLNNRVHIKGQNERKELSPILLPGVGAFATDDVLIPLQKEFLVFPQIHQNRVTNQEENIISEYEKKEPMYAQSIHSTLRSYQQEREIAKLKKANKAHFKQGVNFEQLLQRVEGMRLTCEVEEKRLQQEIERLANLKSLNAIAIAQHSARILGNGIKKLKISELCRLILRKDVKDILSEMNPMLSQKQIKQLIQLIIEFMIVRTNRVQLSKICEPLQAYINRGNPSDLNKVIYELSQNRSYIPKKESFLLHFEYVTGLRLRSQQANIISRILPLIKPHRNDKGIACQSMINSGKSSIFLSELVEIASESGLISCVLSHYSQLPEMKGNLQMFQKERFNKDLLYLPFTLKDLGDSNILDLIKRRLMEAKHKRCGIIMRSTFPQIVQLKFIVECCRLKDTTTADSIQNIKKLAEILEIFEKYIVGFIDECDLVLYLLTVVNVPFGESRRISPERVDLVAAIYQILLDPKIKHLMKLETDEQKDVLPEVLSKAILPYVAEQLFNYPAFSLENVSHLKDAFVRLLLKQISHDDQAVADHYKMEIPDEKQRHNVELLRLLESRSCSPDRYEKESAESVGLACHMFHEVLPKAFMKSFRRNYGPPDPLNSNGEIIPYQGTDAPSKTRFGYLYLSLAVHLQSAIGGGISHEEIRYLANKMMIAAQSFGNHELIPLLETVEAKQFFELTSIQVNETEDPVKLQSAYDFVNHKDFPERRLKLRREVAPFHVRYYTKYVSSNAINFVEHIARPVAFSGTKWNSPSFHPKLGTMIPDEGAEGAIINAIEERDGISSSVHSVPKADLASLIDVIKKHPKKRRIRSIIDGGGFLKSFVNTNSSKNNDILPHVVFLLEFFAQEPDTDIHGIFYLHRFTSEQIAKGYPEEAFVIAKRGEELPVILENTTPDAIEKAGVPLENLFFLVDELRGTGLNCKMAPDTICLQTIDLDELIRTELQNSQRAREFFLEQEIEFCIATEGIQNVLNGNKSMKAVNERLEVNEAKVVSDLVLLSYIKQITNNPRAWVVRNLMSAAAESDKSRIVSLVDNYSQYLITSQGEENLWKNFGRVAQLIPVAKFLDHKATQLSKIPNNSQRDLSTVLSNAAHDKNIPALVKENFTDPIDKEMEFVQEQEVEVEMDQDVAINEELSDELKEYHTHCLTAVIYLEEDWGLPNTYNGILNFSHFSKGIEQVNQILKKTNSTAQFEVCFDNNFYMSKNFERVFDLRIPLLHKDIKTVEFLLIVEEGEKCNFIIVSKKEADYFGNLIRSQKLKNVCLVNIDGIPEAEHVTGSFYNKMESDKRFNFGVQRGLWQANCFQGNISYLESHPKLSLQIISGNKMLFGKFLVLKNANEPEKLALVFRSHLIDAHHFAMKRERGLLFSSRRELMKKDYFDNQSLEQHEVEKISPDHVINLGPHQIPWLKTKEQVLNLTSDGVNSLIPEQIHLLDDSQVAFLNNPRLIEALPPEKVPFMTKEQVPLLITEEQIWALPDKYLNAISPKCVDFLDVQKLRLLTQPSLIEAVATENVRCLTESQIPFIKKFQLFGITDQQIKFLTDEHLPWIEKLPVEKIRFISPKRVHNLSPTQLMGITYDCIDLIQAVPPANIMWLDKLCVKHFTEKQIKAIPVNDRKLVESITKDQMGYIKENHVPFLKSTQIQWIPVTREKLIHALKNHQISYICPEQVPYLKTAQIPLLPIERPDLIQALPIEKIHHLNDQYIQHFSDAQIKAIPIKQRDRIHAIPLHRLSGIHSEQVVALSDKQIGHIPVECVELIQKVGLHKLQHLRPEQVPALSDEQIQALPLNCFELIQAVPLSRISCIGISRVSRLTKEQRQAYDATRTLE